MEESTTPELIIIDDLTDLADYSGLEERVLAGYGLSRHTIINLAEGDDLFSGYGLPYKKPPQPASRQLDGPVGGFHGQFFNGTGKTATHTSEQPLTKRQKRRLRGKSKG